MIYENIFDDKYGFDLYRNAKNTVSDFSMQNFLKQGVLVGFSGGADSVLLLLFLSKLRQNIGDFKILAFHVNHLIRGDEADRDERFAKEFAERLDVEFLSVKIDVPALADELKIGLEEAARNARYSAFDSILQGRNDISSIATAHNSTDNLETVLMNMMRGAGTRGLSGIRPVRDNVIRPLIRIPKKDITELLLRHGVPFVVDSTNLSVDYRRNYIRNEIIPKLSAISSSAENSAMRLSENLRCDDDFIESVKTEFITENLKNGHVSKKKLKALHKAVFARVILAMTKDFGGVSCERVHIDEIYSHLEMTDFVLFLPGELSFVIRGDDCFVEKRKENTELSYEYKLHMGVNEFSGLNGVILISETPFDDSFTNVYKISIQTSAGFDIISDSLLVRSRKDGDSYRYAGMNHKLKKVFNDKSVPPFFRSNIPVICDNSGIIWVAGLPVRDEVKHSDSKRIYLALAHKIGDEKNDASKTLFKATDWQ